MKEEHELRNVIMHEARARAADLAGKKVREGGKRKTTEVTALLKTKHSLAALICLAQFRRHFAGAKWFKIPQLAQFFIGTSGAVSDRF